MDKNANAGDIGFYIREDIPSRHMSFKDKDDDNDIEHSFVEMNLWQKKFISKYFVRIVKRLDGLSITQIWCFE